MKNLMFRGNAYVLHFCLFLLFGLTSCDKEELIPLEEGEFTATETGIEPILVDENEENGRVYGSVDGPPIVSFHESYNFNGTKAIYRHPSTIKNSNGKYAGSQSSIYSSISTANSMTVAPGCKVTIYDQTNYRGGARTFNNQYTDAARYVSAMATPARSFRYECNPNRAKRGNLCAVVGKNQGVLMYTGSSSGLPIYYNTPLSYSNLSGWGWNNTIESIAFMSKDRCTKGITLSNRKYDKTGVSQQIYSIAPLITVKGSRSSLAEWNINNTTSSIIPAGEYYKREDDYLMSKSEAQAIKNNPITMWNSADASPGRLTNVERKFCEASRDWCNQFDYVYDEGGMVGYLGLLACPGISAIESSAQAIKDWNQGYWLASIGNGVKAAFEAGLQVGEVTACATCSAMACAVVAAEKSTKYFGGTNKSCSAVYNDCINGMK
jgi:hypothetical protein